MIWRPGSTPQKTSLSARTWRPCHVTAPGRQVIPMPHPRATAFAATRSPPPYALRFRDGVRREPAPIDSESRWISPVSWRHRSVVSLPSAHRGNAEGRIELGHRVLVDRFFQRGETRRRDYPAARYKECVEITKCDQHRLGRRLEARSARPASERLAFAAAHSPICIAKNACLASVESVPAASPATNTLAEYLLCSVGLTEPIAAAA